MSKCDSNNLALWYGCSPVNLMYIFRAASDSYTHFLSLLPQRTQFKMNQGSWIHFWRLLILLYNIFIYHSFYFLCSGDNFILEGKMKRTKMLASKSNNGSSMWQKVSRIINITKNINATLKIQDEDGERSIISIRRYLIGELYLENQNI